MGDGNNNDTPFWDPRGWAPVKAIINTWNSAVNTVHGVQDTYNHIQSTAAKVDATAQKAQDLEQKGENLFGQAEQGLKNLGNSITQGISNFTGVAPSSIGGSSGTPDDSGQEQSQGLFGGMFRGVLNFLEKIPVIGFFVMLLEMLFKWGGSLISGLFGSNDGSKGAQEGQSARTAIGNVVTSVEHGVGHAWASVTELVHKYHLNPFEAGVIKQESGGNPHALSPKGAQGYMQVMPGTARTVAAQLGETYNPNDPDQNIRLGRAYLNEQLQRYNGDMAKAAAAYNAGPGAVDKAVSRYGVNWLDAMPPETRNYVPVVLANTRHFETMQNQGGLQYASLDVDRIAPPPGKAPSKPQNTLLINGAAPAMS